MPDLFPEVTHTEMVPYDPGTMSSDFWSSLPTTTAEDKARLLRCLTSDSDRVAEHLNKTIHIAHLLLQPIQMDGTDGEIVQATRIVLIDRDGSAYACVSQGIMKSIGYMVKIFGNPPWDPALPMVIRQVELPSKHRMFTLSYVAEGKKSK